MAEFVDLLPEILPDVPGCSDPLAEREIRSATIRFCEESCVLKSNVSPVDIEALEPRYDIVTPAGYGFNSVLWARIGKNAPMDQISEDYLDLAWRGGRPLACGIRCTGDDWRDFTQAEPRAFFIEREAGRDALRLIGIPSAPVIAGLTYRLTLKPVRTATAVTDFVMDDHYRTIAKGALAVLLRIPKKAWTDTARGLTLEEEFQRECMDAKREALKDFTRDDQGQGRTTAYS